MDPQLRTISDILYGLVVMVAGTALILIGRQVSTDIFWILGGAVVLVGFFVATDGYSRRRQGSGTGAKRK